MKRLMIIMVILNFYSCSDDNNKGSSQESFNMKLCKGYLDSFGNIAIKEHAGQINKKTDLDKSKTFIHTYDSIKVLLSYDEQTELDNYKQKVTSYIDKNEKDYDDKNIPLKIVQYSIGHNSINVPIAHITVKNISSKKINAVKIRFYCSDNFNNELGFENGIEQETLSPNKLATYEWTLNLHEATTKISPQIIKVHFTDESEWNNSHE